MKLQYLCHFAAPWVMALVMGGNAISEADDIAATLTPPAHDYPTVARVEYVNECIERNGGKLAAMYQCSCAIDRIANQMGYDDFVEASTFAKYATLPGQGGSIFRDSDHARQLAKGFRQLEADALHRCGMSS